MINMEICMNNGLKILLKAYWSNEGCKNGSVSVDDFLIAKKEGYMFDYPKYISHDEAVKKLIDLVKKVDKNDVSNAFLYSLSTRRLEYRSILGSYYYAKAIKKHEILPDKEDNPRSCYVCGWRKWSTEPDDYDRREGLNVFNFERYKFGGVRHTKLDYAIFDIEEFLKLPTAKDKIILKKILKVIEKMQPSDKAGKFRDTILKEKIFKTNKNEVSNILDLLGICGVLASNDNPCYEDKFVNECNRDPLEYKNDFSYPINRWHVSDGINKEKFEKVFNFKLD